MQSLPRMMWKTQVSKSKNPVSFAIIMLQTPLPAETRISQYAART